MKYVANPVEVDAFAIVAQTYMNTVTGEVRLRLDNGTEVSVTREMCARMKPVAGDYYVIQSDGYVYLNPKEVFERKYHPKAEGVSA